MTIVLVDVEVLLLLSQLDKDIDRCCKFVDTGRAD